MHSTYSDGRLSPRELVRNAKEAGLELLSITDHDSMDGDEEKRAAAESCGLRYLRGWEVSAQSDRKVHILGYACSMDRAYGEFLGKRREESIARAEEMVGKASAYLGIEITMEDVDREHGGESIVHPIYAVRAVARKLGRDDMELYRELFKRGKPAFTEPRRPSPREAIDVIHELGGVAVLAHPGRMAPEGREELMEELVRYGLDGIECTYTTHTVTETEGFLAFAHKHGLYETGGSDFHYMRGKPVLGSPAFEADDRFLARVLPS